MLGPIGNSFQRIGPAGPIRQAPLLTDAETVELRRLDRKIMTGRANRTETLRGIELKRKTAWPRS